VSSITLESLGGEEHVTDSC